MSQQHFNQLTPAEAERLAVLMEECGEVIQVIGKILRHGYDSQHPDGGPNNRELLHVELGHVEYIVKFMGCHGDLNPCTISKILEIKSRSIGQYLHHQEGAQ